MKYLNLWALSLTTLHAVAKFLLAIIIDSQIQLIILNYAVYSSSTRPAKKILIMVVSNRCPNAIDDLIVRPLL